MRSMGCVGKSLKIAKEVRTRSPEWEKKQPCCIKLSALQLLCWTEPHRPSLALNPVCKESNIWETVKVFIKMKRDFWECCEAYDSSENLLNMCLYYFKLFMYVINVC